MILAAIRPGRKVIKALEDARKSTLAGAPANLAKIDAALAAIKSVYHSHPDPDMIDVAVSELSDQALDYAVVDAIGGELKFRDGEFWCVGAGVWSRLSELRYSSDWAYGGLIIERYGIELGSHNERWVALDRSQTSPITHESDHPLKSACRAFVVAEVGEVVTVPAMLVRHAQ